MVIHSMLISTHLSSWRDYLEYHEAKLLHLVSPPVDNENILKYLLTDAKDMKPACTSLTQSLVTFETLKEVRAIEKNILPLEPILASFERLTRDLEEANNVFSGASKGRDDTAVVIRAALTQFRKDATSYRGQVLYMNKRAQSTTQSMLDTLNLSQSKNTFDMGRSAREDSVAIRAITLVTSFYLPFSFVATMFGMNLVDFDSESRNLVLSKQLWLYFVISVPLTALTLACWKWRMRMYRDGDMYEEGRSTVKVGPRKSNSDIEMGQY
ncbi:hypothetical protein J4E83_007928 [Alternaria metachromatica]|uniref:uncharacterized protein n=1 Tax=Alternaria metachromatica TaxID=283354 RepID=UPI0020C3195F|nr:uncharacterized protein J4E83_007928 [Alternaria metachromatica]KAI4611678.1 hypothetical protein J4E83_007928 [Alternaria metachromatica]